MRILITGGAGCLGSNIIEHYLPYGHQICSIDNFSTGKQDVLPKLSDLTLINGTISDTNLVTKIFKNFKPTIVIHSAASYKDPYNWKEDCNTNIIGTINVAKAAIELGVNRFINFQTALCYGIPNKIPIPINHATKPFTSYGISKTAAELYLLQSELPIVSLRLSNICAPRLSIGPIPTFYKRLKEGLDCFCSDTIRDFLDISDFLNLLDLIIKSNGSTGIFNVSTGIGKSVHEVFLTVANYLNIEPPEVSIVPVGEDDVREVVLDPSITEKTFGWSAKIDFSNTISNQLRWYDKYGVNDTYSHLKNYGKG